MVRAVILKSIENRNPESVTFSLHAIIDSTKNYV